MDQATPSYPPDDRVEQDPPSQEPSGNGSVHKTAGEGGAGDPLETVGMTSTATEPQIPRDAHTNTAYTLSHEPDNHVLRTVPEVTTESEIPDPAKHPIVESNPLQNGLAAEEEQKADVTPESKQTSDDVPSAESALAETQSAPERPPKLSERTVSLNGSDSIPSVPPTPPIRPTAVKPETFRRDSLSVASDSGTRSSTPELGLFTNRPRIPPSHLSTHKRSLTASRGNTVSAVLISTALETIANSREAKRSTPLKDSVQRALDLVRSGEGGERPREIFEPLRLACETRNEKLMIASLDCISKLISHSFFAEDTPRTNFTSPPPSPGGPNGRQSGPTQGGHEPSLVDAVVHAITSCHAESTPESVSLQIVKALLALVLSTTTLVHQSSLLKAVRTVYNIFLLSVDPVNQMVAQGGLTQIVNHVFARCKVDPSLPSFPETGSPPPKHDPTLSPTSSHQQTPLSATSPVPPSPAPELQPLSRTESAEGSETGQAKEPAPVPDAENPAEGEGHPPVDVPPPHELTTNDLFIKDSFLVFRALCKLTMKPVTTESERDLKSHAMRSKLLSLHLVLTILSSHMPLIVSPHTIIYSSSNNEATSFVQAINQYLCLCLSRNAVSPVPQVFELSVEIFWRVISGLRTKLKKEIEVLLHEIFIPILEMKTSTVKQKAVILSMLQRLCENPQALVEIYLNYDCDSEAVDNIYEHLMTIISKLGTSHTSGPQPKASDPSSPALTPTSSKHGPGTVPPSLTTSALSVPGSVDLSTIGLSEPQLRRQSIECLVTILKSLVTWGTGASSGITSTLSTSEVALRPRASEDGQGISAESSERMSNFPLETTRQSTPDIQDDPTRFESAKQKKTTLLEGIRKFNFKPKRGIDWFLEAGVIPSRSPQDIARFLLETDGLSKAMIGEYLGEGDEDNIAIMHAFVDFLDFKNTKFVDALRTFLQTFRLPGEAQKIDRFMLKFAERYIDGNPGTYFANADAAYVLAYAVIMLNTDAHNPQIKPQNRMTKPQFFRNTSGINDGADIPEEVVSGIYDDITNNEIRMKDEMETALPAAGAGLTGALVNVGRNLQKEAYVAQTSNMANKTEALFKSLMRSQRKGPQGQQFFSASHFVHVKPMFEVAWLSFLAGLSGPLQETEDNEIVELCLDGFKSAIRLACFFDLELERNAFVTTLGKFTFLNNLGEMKPKNMEAIKTLLDTAITEGNNLKGSWREVLQCVSQLEHMQLITSGHDIPDGRRGNRTKKLPNEDLANESRSTHITVASDMVFSLSHHLNGSAIVNFVQALCDVSWEEIQSSGLSQQPRLFSLQKLVEISYYNMNRIRLEWSNLWDILGEHFNQVCCHSNPHVGFFALDSLRQLAMRFLEKEELAHYKFQKDFLKPFEYTMTHNSNPDIRELVLQCLQQMIQARADNLRSGWRTMFGVFSAASKVPTERIVMSAFEIVTRLNKERFSAIIRQGSFADLTVCMTDFCKVTKYQKVCLLAMAMLRGVIPVMLESQDCSLTSKGGPEPNADDDPMIKYWYPVLFGFYDVIMNGEDLEIRRLGLDSMFTTLKTYGEAFPVDFWDTVCKELLFPIFAVLKYHEDMSRFSTQEDMSVWLSTTMIQALRDLIDLYTFYFETLERFIDGLLDLLCVCICQENDTLARIGTSCLQQLLENNVKKLSAPRWERVTSTFAMLFKTTTPHQLFDDALRVEIDDGGSNIDDTPETNGDTIIPAPLSPSGVEKRNTDARTNFNDRRRVFKQIIVKCVLQLLLIETLSDLLRNDEIYNTMPPDQMLRLMGVLDHSYQFARLFNEDKELRTGLWKVGFMKHLPNLLKQESSSASTLVTVLLRLYFDPRPAHQAIRPQVTERLLPLGLSVLQDFNKLRSDTQMKNIMAWTPVVAEIMHGFTRLDNKAFDRYMPAIYPHATELLSKDMAPEIRYGVRGFFTRVGVVNHILDPSAMHVLAQQQP
ncbi:sec7 guanine nucleotide exchange factor [Thelephora terrestris]|uniref:Sec7 guanine nucleotide exchange factor n=1 Tax=Thelephora terrestris TaxID=56493 RepID=A0A9P6L552_9AGAM|nr:sec7 guanine nucleotide exchange factor [Thelephora terrestris]